MRAYGLPRDKEMEFPDKQTIFRYGLAGFFERARTGAAQKAIRRIWKKKERAKTKQYFASISRLP